MSIHYLFLFFVLNFPVLIFLALIIPVLIFPRAQLSGSRSAS